MELNIDGSRGAGGLTSIRGGNGLGTSGMTSIRGGNGLGPNARVAGLRGILGSRADGLLTAWRGVAEKY
jgi:hypothetical protein